MGTYSGRSGRAHTSARSCGLDSLALQQLPAVALRCKRFARPVRTVPVGSLPLACRFSAGVRPPSLRSGVYDRVHQFAKACLPPEAAASAALDFLNTSNPQVPDERLLCGAEAAAPFPDSSDVADIPSDILLLSSSLPLPQNLPSTGAYAGFDFGDQSKSENDFPIARYNYTPTYASSPVESVGTPTYQPQQGTHQPQPQVTQHIGFVSNVVPAPVDFHSLASNSSVVDATHGYNAVKGSPEISAQEAPKSESAQDSTVKLWALLILSVSYVHQACTGFSLPAMLPLIAPDLQLSDFQGAMLTSGYSYLYAAALIPVGMLADKASRPKLLAMGLLVWSGLTYMCSGAQDFKDLLLCRIGFAAAQATQNPISFSLIPDLFPNNKSTAMAAYNCAIYVGRALAFAGVVAARHMGNQHIVTGEEMVPLDQLDLQRKSVLYTTGDMAVVTPIYNYNFSVISDDLDEEVLAEPSSWRLVLQLLAFPGIAIAATMFTSVKDPRANPKSSTSGQGEGLMKSLWSRAAALVGQQPGGREALQGTGGQGALALARKGEADSVQGIWSSVAELFRCPAFQAVTLAAAFNDLGSYALIAWQSTFYERIYHLDPNVYAPVLATILPTGGIIGGVGGGLLADLLAPMGGRVWCTVGGSLLAAPFIAESIVANRPEESFAALLVGFALSECWRAPAAVMIRSVAPSNLGSTASAMYLCVRNLVGGVGPVAVAKLSEVVGLQRALLFVPACYVMSGILFAVADGKLLGRSKAKASGA